MPYESKAQAAYFNIHKAELEKKGVDVDEWNSASKGKQLPEHKMKDKKEEKKSHKKKKHGMKSSHIEYHGDGSATAKHMMDDGSEQSSAVPDDQGLMDHMQAQMAAPAAGPTDPSAAM